MQRFDLDRRQVTLAICSLLAGCGGGGDDTTPATGSPPPGASDPPPTSPGTGQTPAAGVTAALREGTFWEFLVNTSQSSSSADGNSSSSDYGFFRITLGAPMRVGGVDGYAVAVTGKSLGFAPDWTFLGLTGQRWVASVDGSTLQTIYDPSDGGSGFFLDLPAGRTLATAQGEFAGTYSRFTALVLSDSASDGGCEVVLGLSICSEDSTSFSQAEYLKDGVGPVGYSRRTAMSFGGSFPQVVSNSYTVELNRSSLAPADGSVIVASPWSEGTPLPDSAAPVFAATIGDRIHAYGGTGVYVYDPATSSWSRMPDAPASVYAGAAAGSRVLALTSAGKYLHDTATGSWTRIADLPTSDNVAGAATWNHADGTADIVVVTSPGVAYINGEVWRYSVAANTWSSLGSFEKAARWQFSMTVAGDILYLIGGYTAPSYVRGILAIDLAAHTYSRVAELAEGMIDVSPAVLDGKVYLIGGSNRGSNAHREVGVLDPATGTVTAGPPMFEGRYGAATAVLDGRIHLIGGNSGTGGTSAVAILAP